MYSPIEVLAASFYSALHKDMGNVGDPSPRRPYASELSVYAMFPQTWGSTALGFGGVGGQSFTTAYTVVISNQEFNEFCVYFGGRFAYRIDNPNRQFFEDVANQGLKEQSKSAKYRAKGTK